MADKVPAKESWHDLGREVAPALALENNGHVKEGDLVLMDKPLDIDSVWFDYDIDGDVKADDRLPGGFHFRNSDGHPLEVKYRFSDELRDYPEQIHTHNVPELYVADGRFDMLLATDEDATQFARRPIEDEAFVVPGGVYHGIVEMEEGSDLAVARGDPEVSQYVGKWDLDGEQMYGHVPEELEELPFIDSYEPEQDEMYRMW